MNDAMNAARGRPPHDTTAALDDERVCRALRAYLSRTAGDEMEVSAFRRKSSGFSWITYCFEATGRRDGLQRLVLRVAPPNGLFAPYSVYPQVYALQSLTGTGVPTPHVVAYAQDGAEIGQPFFITNHVEGDVPAPWAGGSLDEAHRRALAFDFIDILGRLHKIDWATTPLATIDAGAQGRRELRSVQTWRASLARPMARLYPILDWGGRWLEENCPAPPRETIVHGDYRIGNFLERDGKITAILDWELTHIGDPHEDLAWAMMPTFNAGSRKFYGVIERNETIERYQRASAVSVSTKSLAYYEAYALFQAAAIQMCAVRAFEVDRFNDMRMAAMASQMAPIVRAFDRAVEAAS